MNTVEMKLEIPLLLEQVEDNFVEAIHTLLKTHQAVKQEEGVPPIPYDTEGNPAFDSVEEMLDEFDRRVDNMKAGNYLTVDQLDERSKAWINRDTK